MVINRLCLIVLFICVASLWACKEKEPITDNPIVITGSAQNNENNTVIFNGSLLTTGNAGPIDYGFVWSNKKKEPTISDYNFRFGKNPIKGSFSSEVNYDLFSDSACFVRAFVATRDAVVYGEVQQFKTKSSPMPRVISIFPKETTGNDTITITGEYLTSKISDISIQYQNYKISGLWPSAKIVYADGKKIRFVLSDTPLTTSVEIFLSVKIRGQDIFPDGKINPPLYINVGPQITGFYPTKVGKNGIVKIKVKNLVGIPDHFTLYSKQYAGYQAIDGVEGDSVRIKLGDYIRYGNHRLMFVTVYNGITYTCYSKDSLEVKHPEITGVIESSPIAGDSITILGKYFNKGSSLVISNTNSFERYLNTRFIGFNKVRSPITETAFDGFNYLYFNSYDGYILKFPIEVKSRWSQRNKLDISLRGGASVLYNDKIILGSWNANWNFSRDIFIYDPSNGSLNLLSKMPENANYQLVFVNGGKLYMFQGRSLDSPFDVVPKNYCFDLNSKVWTPVDNSGWPNLDGNFATCSFNGKTYLKQFTGTKVYSFDPSSSTWQYVNNEQNTSRKTFMVENNAGLYLYYLMEFYTNQAYYTKSTIYKFDESKNKWVLQPEVENIPGIINYMQVSGGYLWFISSSRIFKYSLDGKLIKSFQNDLISSDYPNCRFSANKLYSVLTFSDTSNFLIEFDPNKY